MLMGEYEHSVDAKGRLFVPAKLRSELGKTFVITKGVDGCIDVYPMDAWDRLQQSFAQQTLPKKKARDVSRFLLAIPWKWNRINRAASFCRKRFANLPRSRAWRPLSVRGPRRKSGIPSGMKLIAVKWKAMLPPSWKILKFSD